MSAPQARILFCNCTYARVLPEAARQAVLDALCRSGAPFDAVPDLCESAARRDPLLRALAASGGLRIAACHERAVKGLFAAADAPLPDAGVEILDMRSGSAEHIVRRLREEGAP